MNASTTSSRIPWVKRRIARLEPGASRFPSQGSQWQQHVSGGSGTAEHLAWFLLADSLRRLAAVTVLSLKHAGAYWLLLATGRVNQKVDPSPTVLWTPIWP